MRPTRAVLLVFALVTALNLIGSGSDHTLLKWATKPLLMPLLATYLWLATKEGGARTDRLVFAALALATAGDIALLSSGTAWFITGMLLFLGTQLCYIAAFARGGTASALGRPPLVAVPIGYSVLAVTALAWLWPGLNEVGLALPVAAYAVALSTMATTATTRGWRIGLGGALFLVSDLMIAMGVAKVVELPGPPIWVMATYIAGQALIVTGWAARTPASTTVPA